MDTKYTKSIVISSLIWKLLERVGTQGIQFIVQIVLARLLTPEDFGTVAIVMVFVTVARIFIESGFNTALIQRQDTDEEDFSSVFYLSLFVAGLMVLLIFFISPLIGNYYGDPLLSQILRVLSISLLFGAFNSVQNAYIAKYMLFKKMFLSNLGAILVSGFAGIMAAYVGWGVWALVLQQLINQLVFTIIIWFIVKWRPKLEFSISRIKILFSFGWRILISRLINTLYMNIRTLVIGRIYSPSLLGYYSRGEQLPRVIVESIDGSLQTVMLPTFSSQQDNHKKLKDMVRRSISTSSFLIFPMMIGLAAIAEPIVITILTDKWLPSVPFLQILCISYAFMPIHTSNLQAINALGRSEITLKLQVLKKLIGLVILVISIPFGIYAIAIGMVVSSIISSFINAYPNRLLIDYTYKEQLLDILPSLLVSIIMGGIVYLFNFLSFAPWKILILQVGTGIIIYISLAKIFKIESFEYLTMTIKEMLKNKKGVKM